MKLFPLTVFVLWSIGAMAGELLAENTGEKSAAKVTTAKAGAGCNEIILMKRTDAAGLLKCDIAEAKSDIAGAEFMSGWRIRGGGLAKHLRGIQFHDLVIKRRGDVLEALEAGAITKREAISMRSNQIASEHKYLAEDAKRDAQENSQPMPAYQPASSSTPIYLPAPVSPSQPKSVTCQPRDIFGKVKCDFE